VVLAQIGRMLRQQWWLAALGVLLTVGMTAGFLAFAPRTYASTATMVLLPPSDPDGPQNPYMYLSNLRGSTDVISDAMMAPEVGQAVAAVDPKATYSVTADATTPAPILVITADAPTPAASLQVLDTVTAAVPGTLKRLQNDIHVPAAALISTTVLSRSAEAVAASKTLLRYAVVIAVAGLVLTLLAAAGLDAFQRSRSAKSAGVERDPASGALGPAKPQAARPEL
jgi:hypothetical protein